MPGTSERITVSASGPPRPARVTCSKYSPGPIVSVSPVLSASRPFWMVANALSLFCP